MNHSIKELMVSQTGLMALGLLISLQTASQVSIGLLGIYHLAPPYAIFVTISHHFYFESLVGAITGVICFLLGFLWYWGGLMRYLSQLIITGLLLIAFFASLGVSFFLAYEDLPSMAFFELSGLLQQSPTAFNHLVLAETLSVSLMFLIIGGLAWDKYRPASKALGDAHFANGVEVQTSGFFKKEDGAVLIGKKYGVPLWSNGFEHVLVFASSGSGKTRSISIPNLFQYPYSVVCNDVKLSIYKATSGYREKVLGHRCYCFAPTQAKTHRFNPLSFISSDKLKRMTDIQRIAHILIPDSKKADPIWSQASRKLFKTVVLYLLDTPGNTATLGEINRLIKKASFDDWLLDLLMNTEHYDPEFYRNGFSYINNHDKTRGSIKESFSGYFELFDDPIIDAATSATDFDITALRREKITIYIGFTDDDMERLAPLLTLFWQQLISSMIQEVPDLQKEPYPVLCLLDEFSSLGRIERLRRSLKLLREYRVRCVLMMQYIAQTYEQYSHDEAKAFTNIKTKIAYAAEDIHDAEYISKLMGTKTKKIKSGSVSTQTRGYSESQSYTYQAIPLMRPEQISKMSMEKALIIKTGHSPLKADQYIWYNEPGMKNLSHEPAFVPTQEARIYAFDHGDKRTKTAKIPGEKALSEEAFI